MENGFGHGESGRRGHTARETDILIKLYHRLLQKSMKKDQELIVITKTYDLILWSCNHTSKFPRNHRFVLGERIERNLYGLLETLIAAKYTKNRQRLLEDANLALDILAVPDAAGEKPAMNEGPELRLRRQVHRRDRAGFGSAGRKTRTPRWRISTPPRESPTASLPA